MQIEETFRDNFSNVKQVSGTIPLWGFILILSTFQVR